MWCVCVCACVCVCVCRVLGMCVCVCVCVLCVLCAVRACVRARVVCLSFLEAVSLARTPASSPLSALRVRVSHSRPPLSTPQRVRCLRKPRPSPSPAFHQPKPRDRAPVTVLFRRALHGSMHHLATFVHVDKHCGCQDDRFVVTTCLLHGMHQVWARIIGEQLHHQWRSPPTVFHLPAF